MICFRYYGEPVGKGRPRVTARKSKKNDNAVFAHAYTPKKTREFEDAIRFEFKATTSEPMPLFSKDIPLGMGIVMAFSVPKSYTKKRTKACLSGEEMHTKKPDADNVAKAVMDALQGLAFEDDSQVVYMTLEKVYRAEPFVEVKIYPLRGAGYENNMRIL